MMLVGALQIQKNPKITVISNRRKTYTYWKTLTLLPLPSTRQQQHPSYDDCLEVKTEYYQNCCVLDCVTQGS